ncbi:spindle and kinetochore-associated protein 2-like [Haliotis rufescens]|uniref:spindle and kinetochore-associated protein 2-like n=1 Tax=Haliotis rufescens TaxID=6454 RepID=UPI001EB003EB|nr:spindle and kinetochore-associated protein 2-like [Haliotis rufescens]
MEKSVETLEAMFQKTESDLDYLSRKLDFEFDNSGNAEANPVRLMQKVSEIKKEYGNIVQEAVAIQETQKEAMDYFRSQLLSACQMLQKLQTDTEAESESVEKPAALCQLEQLLGVDTSSITQTASAAAAETPHQQDQGGGDISASTQVAEAKSEAPGGEPQVSPSSRREGCTEMVEVSQAEFESVSALVRGRVKLADVNTTYSVLWRHFKDEGNSAPLNAPDMHKMGLRVTGATGEAKLKVLRALKLLNMTRKGEVTLV